MPNKRIGMIRYDKIIKQDLLITYIAFIAREIYKQDL